MGVEEILSKLFGGFTDKMVSKLDEIKPKDVQIVQVRQNPDSFSSSELEKVKTTNQKWTNKDNPLLEFKNILEKESTVKEISVVPDSVFKTKGKLLITVDDVPVFRSRTFDAFEDLQENVIKVNKTISQDSKVKFFMISSDGTEIGLTAQVTFGDD